MISLKLWNDTRSIEISIPVWVAIALTIFGTGVSIHRSEKNRVTEVTDGTEN